MKKYIVQVKNKEYEVFIREVDSKNIKEEEYNESSLDEEIKPNNAEDEAAAPGQVLANIDTAGSTPVVAPMSGKVLAIKVEKGERVEKGQVIMTIEAMKMETEIVAAVSGSISAILVTPGTNCKRNDKLILIKEAGGV